MSQIATHSTFSTSGDAAEAAPHAASRFGHALKTYLYAMREGAAASHRYEALRNNGLSHEQAIARAMSDTGFGT